MGIAVTRPTEHIRFILISFYRVSENLIFIRFHRPISCVETRKRIEIVFGQGCNEFKRL